MSVPPNIEGNQLTVGIQLKYCVSEISDWVNRNTFKINEDYTEFLTAGTSQQYVKVLFYSLSVNGTIISASTCVKTLVLSSRRN